MDPDLICKVKCFKLYADACLRVYFELYWDKKKVPLCTCCIQNKLESMGLSAKKNMCFFEMQSFF